MKPIIFFGGVSSYTTFHSSVGTATRPLPIDRAGGSGVTGPVTTNTDPSAQAKPRTVFSISFQMPLLLPLSCGTMFER